MAGANSQGNGHQSHDLEDDAHKDDARKDDARKDDARKDDARKDDAQRDNSQKNNAQRDDAQKDGAQKTDAQKDDAEKDNTPDNDAQTKDTQNDDAHQNSDALIVFDYSQGQDSISSFENYFTFEYPFQESVMSYLNRLDFSNLQLAGLRTPISQELRRNHLIPSKCDEVLIIPGINPTTCSNTTQSVNEIRTCHGRHRDGQDLQGIQERWIEPPCLFKHVRDSDSFVQTSHDDEGGHFDSFNVCIHCHNRDQWSRNPDLNFTVHSFYSTMCQRHCLEYVEQRPYNACRCKTFLNKYWRCNACSLETLEGLRDRAKNFGEDLGKRAQLNRFVGMACHCRLFRTTLALCTVGQENVVVSCLHWNFSTYLICRYVWTIEEEELCEVLRVINSQTPPIFRY